MDTYGIEDRPIRIQPNIRTMFIMHRPFLRRPDGLLWTQNIEYEWKTYDRSITKKDTMGPLRKQLVEHLCKINGYQPLTLPHVNCASLGPIRSLTDEIDWTHPI